MKKLNVLSLFDGISCARMALARLGLKPTVYYSSEIDDYANKISQKNWDDIVRIGTVENVRRRMSLILPDVIGFYELHDIDLLIGGSPCQDLSIAKSGRKGLAGARSGLFWEYVRILKEVRPKYFVLENVASMPQEAKDLITKTLGVEPIMIDASLVSAQRRKRLFWTNIPGVTQPKDRGIFLKDILEDIPASDSVFQYRRTYWRETKGGKVPTLTANMGTGGHNVPFILQTARGFNKGGKKFDKVPTLSSSAWEQNHKLNGIRKLTPVECERLQGLAEIEQSCIIRVCKDNQKNSVSVANQNLKSLKSVGNVEKIGLKESVLSAEKSLSIKYQQTNNVAQPDVLISCEEKKIEIFSQGKLLASVSGAELKQNVPHLKSLADFVQLIVGLNTIVERTAPFGEAELPQKSSLLVVKENGNNVVKIYGKEITQLAEGAKKDLTILNKLLKSTTLGPSTQENKEQIIQTLFSYVVLAILGFIPKEIQNQNTLTFQIKSKVGYTSGISNTQRYKSLGNAFNVDVIAHILSFAKF